MVFLLIHLVQICITADRKINWLKVLITLCNMIFNPYKKIVNKDGNNIWKPKWNLPPHTSSLWTSLKVGPTDRNLRLDIASLSVAFSILYVLMFSQHIWLWHSFLMFSLFGALMFQFLYLGDWCSFYWPEIFVNFHFK